MHSMRMGVKMKKRLLLVVCILAFSILFTTTYAKTTVVKATATTEQSTDQYDYSNVSLKKDSVVVKYIKIKNLSDTKKQKKINAILKADAESIADVYDTKDSSVTFDMTVKAKYIKDTELFIVTYTVYYNELHSAHPSELYYVSVIDTNNASRVTYTDKTEIKNIAKAIKMGKFTIDTKNKELAAAQRDYLMGLKEDELLSLLENINFRVVNKKIVHPYSFMYKAKNSVKLSIPTIHVIGDHAEITIKNSDLK